RTQILSVIRAVRGINSPTMRPGVADAIGLSPPLISLGASGFGSQGSCCGGPPSRPIPRTPFPRPPRVASLARAGPLATRGRGQTERAETADVQPVAPRQAVAELRTERIMDGEHDHLLQTGVLTTPGGK